MISESSKNHESPDAEIIDSQVHIWLTDRPDRPWIPDPWAGKVASAEKVFRAQLSLSCPAALALDELAVAGVRRAVLAPLMVYGTDVTLEAEAVAEYPDRLSAVAAVDYTRTDLPKHLEELRSQGFRGIRIPGLGWQTFAADGFHNVFAAAGDLGMTVFFNMTHPLPSNVHETFDRFSGVNFVVDQLGLSSAPPIEPLPEEPFAELPLVLPFARHDNVHVKITAAPAYSRATFPFPDIHDAIRILVHAFGAKRIIWASDFTRTNCLYSYTEGLTYLEHVEGLTPVDLARIRGGNIARLLGIWS
ncbi:amidohydrolase family protein [Pseudarthrobacter sp. YAF2]|uniref:amidohydrolase family protein n=1 Tax=Pseudarthrobacter sp. YAF2 TaxID=3233078 RepID=UPI003F947CC6